MNYGDTSHGQPKNVAVLNSEGHVPRTTVLDQGKPSTTSTSYTQPYHQPAYQQNSNEYHHENSRYPNASNPSVNNHPKSMGYHQSTQQSIGYHNPQKYYGEYSSNSEHKYNSASTNQQPPSDDRYKSTGYSGSTNQYDSRSGDSSFRNRYEPSSFSSHGKYRSNSPSRLDSSRTRSPDRYRSGSDRNYGNSSSSYQSQDKYGYRGNSYNQDNKKFSKGMSSGSYRDPFAGDMAQVNWADYKLKDFIKNFYVEHPDVQAMDPSEADEFRAKHNMKIYGDNIPKPVRTFQESAFPEYIMTELRNAGFDKPTPIQSQGWPMALGGRDVIGISATGSGKTLAFILPAIIHINAQPLLDPGDGPIALVLSPTRELAVQIVNECYKFCTSSSLKFSCVYGGVPKHPQARELARGVEILIATPGRLLDFLQSKATNLRRVTYLVLDEADRMLDMGFEQQIRSILSQIRPDRQTLLWSATWPVKIQALARDFTYNPIQVTVGSTKLKANQDITQIVKVLQNDTMKLPELLYLLRNYMEENSKVIIFSSTKRNAENIAYSLRREGIHAQSIHGNKAQDDRDRVLRLFRSGEYPILIATDVVSRGIDIPDIKLVINFDFPTNLEDYVHRVGRTGRAGNKGTAISFVTYNDSKRADEIISLLKESNQYIPDELYMLARPHYKGPR